MKIKYSIINAGISVIRAIYAPMKLQKTKKKITIISRQSNTPSMDIALLSDYIKEKYPDVECKVMCRQFETVNKIMYCFHMLSQMMNMASSKVVILDGYCIAASILNHKDDTKIVQMWHALAAIKKFGYQTIGKPSGRSREVSEVMCMHRNYDYVLCSGQATGRHFSEAFNVPQDKLRYVGLPRIDVLLSEDKEMSDRIISQYDLNGGNETILYVPTFRRGSSVQVQSLIEAIDPDKFNLVVKLHPLDRSPIDTKSTKLRVIVDNSYSSYDWLRVCDRVITDYSALGVEVTLTGKPLYYYVYDIDEYEAAVGLNVNPLEEMPSVSAKDAGSLKEIMEKPYDFESLKEFRNRYISVNTDNCTEQLGDFIYGIIEEAF